MVKIRLSSSDEKRRIVGMLNLLFGLKILSEKDEE